MFNPALFQTVAEMEGITHGIRPGSPRKVQIKVPQSDGSTDLSNKALRIQAKYGVKPLAKKKEENKSMRDMCCALWKRGFNAWA